MPFDVRICDIPVVYCGSKNIPRNIPGSGKRYTRIGTNTECLRQGFGAGYYSERNKHLPEDSIQHIKYVGDVYEDKFVRAGINGLTGLKTKCRSLNSSQIQELLRGILLNKRNILDLKAFNSVLVYLYTSGFTAESLPSCVLIPNDN